VGTLGASVPPKYKLPHTLIEPSCVRTAKALLLAFAALKADGSITAWGDLDYGGSGAPSGSGYTKIYSTKYAFAALKADGSIKVWGSSISGHCQKVRLCLQNMSHPTP
jgi:hypothetical protein